MMYLTAGTLKWPIIISSLLILFGGTYIKGRSDGKAIIALKFSEAAREKEQELTRLLSQQAWELERAEEKLQVTRGALNREAATDPDAAKPAISDASLQRIRRAFGDGGG